MDKKRLEYPIAEAWKPENWRECLTENLWVGAKNLALSGESVQKLDFRPQKSPVRNQVEPDVEGRRKLKSKI